MYPSVHADPYAADSVSTTAMVEIGKLYTHKGNLYKYLKNDGADAFVAGDVVGPHTNGTPGSATSATATWVDGGLGTVAKALGMACYACAAASYCYVLVVGPTTNDGTATGTALLSTDGGVAQGDWLVVDGGADPVDSADTAAAGEEHAAFGYALAADTSGNKVIAEINCL